jgi:hypothetical protein
MEGWSPRSRTRMMRRFASLDYSPLYQRGDRQPILVTLTYPRNWLRDAPTPRDARRQLETFKEALRHGLGQQVVGLWKLEFTRDELEDGSPGRSAPHFHLLLALPAQIRGVPIRSWISRQWALAVKSDDPLHIKAGTNLSWTETARFSDPLRIAIYFSRHASPGGRKAQQHKPHSQWIDTGQRYRWWGYWGLRSLEQSVDIPYQVLVELRRLCRRRERNVRTQVIRKNLHRGSINSLTGEVRTRKVPRRRRPRSLYASQGAFVLHPDAPAFLAQALPAAVKIADWKGAER